MNKLPKYFIKAIFLFYGAEVHSKKDTSNYFSNETVL